MNDDLVKRLRKYAADPYNFRDVHGSAQASSEAADEIERLTAEVDLRGRIIAEYASLEAERDALRKRIEDEAAKAQPEQSDIKP